MPKVIDYYSATAPKPVAAPKLTASLNPIYSATPNIDIRTSISYILEGTNYSQEQYDRIMGFFQLNNATHVDQAEAVFLAIRISVRLYRSGYIDRDNYGKMVNLLVNTQPANIINVLRENKIILSSEYVMNLSINATMLDYINELGYIVRDPNYTIEDAITVLESSNYDLFSLPTYHNSAAYEERRRRANNPDEGVEFELCNICKKMSYKTIMYTSRAVDEAPNVNSFCVNRKCSSYRS